MAVHDGTAVSGTGAGGAGVAMGMMTQNPQAVTLVASSMPSGMTQPGQPQVQPQVSVDMFGALIIAYFLGCFCQ